MQLIARATGQRWQIIEIAQNGAQSKGKARDTVREISPPPQNECFHKTWTS